MVQRLAWLCGAEWLLGLSGMLVARGLFSAPSDDATFQAFSGMWLAGLVGFLVLGAIALIPMGLSEPEAIELDA